MVSAIAHYHAPKAVVMKVEDMGFAKFHCFDHNKSKEANCENNIFPKASRDVKEEEKVSDVNKNESHNSSKTSPKEPCPVLHDFPFKSNLIEGILIAVSKIASNNEYNSINVVKEPGLMMVIVCAVW